MNVPRLTLLEVWFGLFYGPCLTWTGSARESFHGSSYLAN